jgi:hypothetical protein
MVSRASTHSATKTLVRGRTTLDACSFGTRTGSLRTLRWPCITYQNIPAETHGSSTEWALTAQVFGESSLPRSSRLQ